MRIQFWTSVDRPLIRISNSNVTMNNAKTRPLKLYRLYSISNRQFSQCLKKKYQSCVLFCCSSLIFLLRKSSQDHVKCIGSLDTDICVHANLKTVLTTSRFSWDVVLVLIFVRVHSKYSL